jgi:hypothetical protein
MSVLAELNGRRGDQHRAALSVLRTVGEGRPARTCRVAAHFSAKIRAVLAHAKVSMRSNHSNSGQSELRLLAAESAHRVTGVASFILVADIGDQCLRTLHLNFEGGDQRVFRVNDNVSRFPLKFKANRKLHLCTLPISVESSTTQLGGVKLTKLLNRCRHLRSNLGDWPRMPPS